ncbi:hypothetical protein RC74_07795 [Falsihalocynthiibacter arcticus]|uniref:Uncharacterized protein n=1 Tax=Falsihalocynthiibacter arcticus TaxID=1579316 RepID=A0A126UYQ1_9RHOB|nr:hypothetical protein RC74_07795 [Falsihalocynthiibacter arcticus]
MRHDAPCNGDGFTLDNTAQKDGKKAVIGYPTFYTNSDSPCLKYARLFRSPHVGSALVECPEYPSQSNLFFGIFWAGPSTPDQHKHHVPRRSRRLYG